MRIRPYRTTDDKIDGAVLQMLDIDDLKRSLDDAKAARAYAEAIVDTVREPLVVLDSELRVQRANRSFYQTFRPDAAGNRRPDLLCIERWRVGHARRFTRMLDEILQGEASCSEIEIEHDFGHLGRRTMCSPAAAFNRSIAQV